jgi:eukaryotic-like serine/threonine-protein kinase
VMHIVRRLPLEAPVRKPDTDADVLRLTASAANDAVDAISTLTGPRAVVAIGQVARRYARALGINARDVTDALQAARESVRKGTPLPPPKRGDTLTDALDAPAAPPDAAATEPASEPAPTR